MVSSKEYRFQRLMEGRPVVDNRKRSGNRHKPGYVRPHITTTTKAKTSKWERRCIVAWDGEGANLPSGEHVYNLLANSNEDYIANLEGLATIDIFDFFMTHSNEGDINVIFGGSYDINMILKDLSKDKLQMLWSNGKVYWRGYRIMWAPRKKFTLQLLGSTNKPRKTFVLWDVIGYFQSSFVVACKRWLGDFDSLAMIEDMKQKRSVFKSEDISQIIEYNKMECALLVLLMQRLFASLDEAEVQLMRYDGAGSIAAALLRKHGIHEYKGNVPKWINSWAQYAYSGGRIEAIKCGTTVQSTPIYRYDINSAYPSACLTLPSYINATWEKQSDWDGSNNSMVCVKYHYSKEASFYPLWYRTETGSIIYPRNGMGIYWGAEVTNLYKYYEEGKDFTIEWAINCTLDNDDKPFTFINDLYTLRKKFKAEGSMASESLKLGLNSIYGKLVQQAGYREGRIPTYHQLLWGGQITAYTRAKLFDAAMQSPKDVISFATDAVFSTKKLDLPCSGELGDWAADSFTGITVVQAGVYFLHAGTNWQEKFRGFDKGSLNREKIIECWENDQEYKAKLTRFVGLGSALMAIDFTCWRTWRTDNRKLDIKPTGKRIAGTRTDYHKGLRVTKPAPNLTSDLLSQSYAIEWMDGIKNSNKEIVEGIPLEVYFHEIEDGEL